MKAPGQNAARSEQIMTTPIDPQKRPDYGLDAPPVIRNLLLVAGVALAVATLVHFLGVPHPLWIPVREVGLVVAANCLLNATVMVWYSKVGKHRGRERLLDRVPWRGDEAVLDVGCGRGLLLVGAARRLTTGKAVGVDLWQAEDLSGNRPEATLENARLEGVAQRLEVKTGDARQLPFPDASFDVVVSGLTLHNIYDRAGRQQAVREIARVLRPGGHVAVADIQHTGEYVAVLREHGVPDAHRLGSWRTIAAMISTWGGVRPYWVLGRKAPAVA
jgi:ubiquinone/menaquinone biosynthesis C-methylase UbiE